jgi:hypothetical protein
MNPDRMTFALELMGLMTLAICVLAICGAIVASKAFARTQVGAAVTFSRLIQRSGGLQLLTVQTIVMSALVLAIVGVLDGAATVSVLSGVAGYVLGKGTRGDDDGPGRGEPAPEERQNSK